MSLELYLISSAPDVRPYATIRRLSDMKVLSCGPSDGPGGRFVEYADANLDNYDLPLPPTGGGSYARDLPNYGSAFSAGVYVVAIYHRGESAPASNDTKLKEYRLYWTGTAAAPEPVPTPTDDDHRLAKLITLVGPGGPLLTKVEIADHLKISTFDADDSSVKLMLAAATDYAEERLGMCLLPRTLMATFYDSEPLVLPRGPLLEVVSVSSRGTDVGDYAIHHVGNLARIVPKRSAVYPVSVIFRAGYESSSGVDPSILLAILTHVGTLFENRESTSERARLPVPHSLDAFYDRKSWNVGVA